MRTKTNRTLRKIFSIALCLVLVMSYVPMVSITASAAATDITVTIDTGAAVTLRDADGDDYYDIGTADELYAFAQIVNNGNYAINGELTADITVNENVLTSDGGLNGNVSNFREWTPIGNGDNNYAGIFDGDEHTVRGLYFNSVKTDCVGLFGIVAFGGKVQNIGIIDSYINGSSNVGSVIGRSQGTITNCYNEGSVSGYTNVGGVVGNSYGSMTDCYNKGTVRGLAIVGGVVGFNNNTVTNVHNTGTVTGSGDYVGGVVGYSGNNSTMANCYNTGTVTGNEEYVGGVVGYSGSNSTVTNCYNTGSVSGKGNFVGGVLGKNGSNDIVMNCYYLSGCATDGNDVTQFGIGNETAGSTTADVTGQTASKTADWFASGEVCTAVGYHVGASAANGFCDLCIYDAATLNADNYYEISNGGQLFWFGNYINTVDRTANAVITADIDLEGKALSPIGKAANKYAGVFDGQGHTISNFHIHITSVGNWGLFGYITGEGTVIKNFSISGDVTTALTSNVDVQYGVVGQADGGAEIRNVHSSVNLTSGDSYQKKYFGGIVGRTGNITVDMCSYSGKLSLGSNTLDCVGGIVGYVYNGKTAKINNCGFYGSIESTYTSGNVGGILGYYNGENAKALTISNCLSIGALPSGRGAVIGTISNYGSTNAGSNNYYLDGLAHSVTNITANSASQKGLENGRIAYYLQSNNTEQVWGQDIDNGKPRQYVPTINAGKLYKVPVCGGDTGYSNSSETNGHNYIDYKCVFCGMYTQPPKGDTYYLISNIGHLLWWQQAINEAGANEMYVKLVADIDLNPGYVFNEDGTVLYNGKPVTSGWYEWTPMGTEEEPSGGEFFGNNHTISGIYINSDIDYAGFFGVTYNANIKDFNISNAYIKGKTSAGGLCGKAMYSKITNCVSNATVSAEINAGGICGEIKQTNFYQCGNNGNIDGYYAGGICGYEPMGEPGKVYFGYMENCYNTGDITGESYAGGLFGSRIDTQCYNCFNIGKVTSDANAHDISTFHFNNKNCYYLSETETEDGGKTVEQFASGEVAYLLQQGNTEQVWGQMSNTEGSLPIITDNELYKVVTVGETGNYSVANVGDTNGDGTVDVTDYQALVNTVLADNHEQIETASYDDIIRYDLDGDGYLDVIDAYLLHLFINGFTTVDVYAVGDYDLNGKAFEEADIKVIKHAIENPEKLATYKKYASDINGDGKLDENDLTALTSKYGEVTGTECADNVEVYYRWGNNYATCTATAMCTLCGEKVATETVNTTSETLAELTCTQDGKVKYTATFQNELLGTKTIEIVSKTEGHKFDDNGFCLTCDVYQPAELNESGYYEIGNAGQLFWFAQQVNVEGNKEIKGALTADIHLENKPWTPIGAMDEENSFRGVFDGQNYTIRGLNVEGSENGVGFFGEVRTGTVKNFTIYGEVVANTDVNYVGGVIGSICGLNGENDLERNGAIIQNITSYVNVTANAHGIGMIGGFVGYADHQSLIEKCSWYGTFDAGEYHVDSGAGGFIGKIQENTGEVTIRNCAAYGTIKTNYAGDYNNYATIYMGGFLSFSNTNAKTTLENCLFAGKFERGENLTDEARLGAYGTLRSVNAIKNCYYLGDDGLVAVHSDSPLKPGSDNVEITKVTEDDLRNNTIATQLGEYWEQGEHYPVIKK